MCIVLGIAFSTENDLEYIDPPVPQYTPELTFLMAYKFVQIVHLFVRLPILRYKPF